MAINLLESARLAQNNGEFKKAGVIMTFAEQSQLLAAFTRVPIQGNVYKVTREAAIDSTVAFRAPNAAYAEGSGVTEDIYESLRDVGGDLDVDTFFIKTMGMDVRTTHESMKAKALARKVGYSLVKGSITATGGATADTYGIDGLQARLGGGFGSTTVATTGALGGQIVTNDGASDALSIAKLDETIMKVDNPNAIVLPKKLAIRLTTKLRNSSSITTSRDEFGRVVTSYNGIPLIYADNNGELAAIGFDENNDSTTSLYVLNLSEDGLHLIESPDGIDVRDLGEQDSKPVFRTRVQWLMGMVDEHPRCMARLFNIADLTAVD